MQLHLRVKRYQRAAPERPMSAIFDVSGGLIGRSAACDWQLPDPHRYVSGSHARIAFDGDNFTLTDVSSNGIFLNGSRTPIGRDTTVKLKDGDALSIGEYQVEAQVVGADASTRESGDGLEGDTFAQLGASLDSGPAAAGSAIESPAREDLAAFFGGSDSLAGMPDADLSGEAAGVASGPGDLPDASGRSSSSSASSTDETAFATPAVDNDAEPVAPAKSLGPAPSPPGTSPGTSPGRTPQGPPHPQPPQSPQPEATTTLLMAMELDRAMAGSTATPVELLRQISQLMEAMTTGYADLMQLRARRKDAIGAARPMPWQTRSPLEDRSLVGSERVAALLLRGDEAVQLVRECVRDLDAHERAGQAATEAALRAVAGEHERAQDDVDKRVDDALRGAYARAYQSEEQQLRPPAVD